MARAQWNPLDGELRTLLDRKTYVSLSRERRRKELSVSPQDTAKAFTLSVR